MIPLRVGIVFSREDAASMNIRRFVLEGFGLFNGGDDAGGGFHSVVGHIDGHEVVLGTTPEPLLTPGDLDEEFDADVLIFASRHKSESGEPAILVHPTGNWAGAKYGGEPRRVSRTTGVLIREAYRKLVEVKSEFSLPHGVSMEVTHHGPTELRTPMLFIELGSTDADWRQEAPARAVARAILHVAKVASDWVVEKTPEGHWIPPGEISVGIGFGGTHYAPQFNKLVGGTNYATSHIVPKYYAREVTRELVEHILDRVAERVSCFILDWKGLNAADKNHLLPILESFQPEVEVLRARRLLKKY
ncbi:MAG: D-aminoacyl-tRNA deacylase [Promethearchaeota archaeon]